MGGGLIPKKYERGCLISRDFPLYQSLTPKYSENMRSVITVIAGKQGI